MDERRKHERIDTSDLFCMIREKSRKDHAARCDIMNLSTGGALMRCPFKIRANEMIEITFVTNLADKNINLQIRGLVVHVQPEQDSYKIGVQFINPLKEEENLLKKIIHFHKVK
jgi:hypothetical protein